MGGTCGGSSCCGGKQDLEKSKSAHELESFRGMTKGESRALMKDLVEISS